MIVNIIKTKFVVNIRYFEINNEANSKNVKKIEANIWIMTK